MHAFPLKHHLITPLNKKAGQMIRASFRLFIPQNTYATASAVSNSFISSWSGRSVSTFLTAGMNQAIRMIEI
jgi:hypothetical protein